MGIDDTATAQGTPAPVTAGTTTPDPAEAITAVANEAEALMRRGANEAAAELLFRAVEQHGESAALLWPLARVLFRLRDDDLALELMEQAALLEPDPKMAARERILLLSAASHVREALAVIEGLPPGFAQSIVVGTAIAAFYQEYRYRFHAREAQEVLARALNTTFIRALLHRVRRYTNPFTWLRRPGLAWEKRALITPERHAPPYFVHLGQASGLTGSALSSLEAAMASASVDVRFAAQAARVVERYQYWVVMAWVVAPLALTLTAGADTLAPAFRPADTARPSLGSALVALVFAALFYVLTRSRRFWHVNSIRRAAWFAALGVAAVAGAVEAYLHHIGPNQGWGFWVGYGLIVAPPVTMALLAVDSLLYWYGYSVWRRTMENAAHFEIIDDLLWLIHRLRSPGLATVVVRRANAALLERAAAEIRVFLLPAKHMTDLVEKDWIVERAAGWARALRRLERGIIAATAETTAEVDRALCHAIRCLATGDLGALEWLGPQEPASGEVRRRRRILKTVRDVLVAVLPIGATFAAHAFGYLPATVFHWAVPATGLWALLMLLMLLMVLDPDLNGKITMVGQVSDVLHNARSGVDGDKRG